MQPSALQRDLGALLGRDLLAPIGDFEAFETPARYGRGRAAAVVLPRTVEEIRTLIRYCYAEDVPLVLQGANTGLVGASTPNASGEQVVLSTARLTDPPNVNRMDRTAIAGAGVRLSALNKAAEAYGLCLPIDLGADPSIGGMVATNTGGARLIRYGDVRRNLLGVEIVAADEEASLFSDLRGLAKDNSGLHLPSLVCGGGGGLGVVTRACVRLHRQPAQSATMLLVPRSESDIPDLIAALEDDLGDILTAYEGMSRNAMSAALEHTPSLRNPFAGGELPTYAVLVEVSAAAPRGPNLDVEARLMEVLESWMAAGDERLQDVILGRGPDLWSLRHAISGSLARAGGIIGFDVSMPRSELPAFHAAMRAEVAERFPMVEVCDFGHCGDGGDHFNLVVPLNDPRDLAALSSALRDLVYDEVVRVRRGSFSAEHGIGPANLPYYRRYVPAEMQAVAAKLHRIFDPKGLFADSEL